MAQPASSLPLTTGHLPISGSRAGLWRVLRTLLLVSALLTVVMNPGALTNTARLALTFAITLAYSMGLWFVNGFAVDWLNGRISWAERPLRRLLSTLALSIGGSVTVILLIQAAYLLAAHESLALLRQPQMYGQVLVPLGIAIIISLFNHSRSFFLRWREATVRAERLEKESAIARLDSLRRQVDPHFLFNSLNALTSLVEDADPARAVRFIRQLSSVYRYVLDSQSHELVPLAEELAFAESYIFLQKTRLDEALQVELALPPAAELSACYLPPLALQLLLENALKHNTAFQADPLRLLVAVDAPARTLTVRNTLRPRRLSPAEASGRGLDNLRARYGFLTQRPVEAGAVGQEFVVTLPLLAI